MFLANDYGLMTVFSFSLLRVDELVHIEMLLHVHVLRYATLAFTISHIVCLFKDTNSQGTKENSGSNSVQFCGYIVFILLIVCALQRRENNNENVMDVSYALVYFRVKEQVSLSSV